jgi:anaerobic selenocysteine-containing dehydrogenase
MNFDLTRRDVLGLGAGAAVGVMATPAPWKAIDDLSIWTQNWKWIPQVPKGPVSMRATTCSLCPAGCPVTARCIGGLPVSMHPVADEQSLCTLGLTGHHLSHHPARMTSDVRVIRTAGAARRIPARFETIAGEVRQAVAAKRGSVALLDTRPGRSASHAWRRYLASLPDALYLAAPGAPGSSFATLATLVGTERDSLAVDLASARTVVSFGAPLADGWGDPQTMRRVLRRDPELRIIQIEAVRSATASAAQRWVPALPGSEASLALGIAHVLIAEGRVDAAARARIVDYDDYATLAARFTPERVSRATAVPASEIVAIAREMVERRPALVLAGEDAGGGRFDRIAETAILGLNLLLGNGGIVQRESSSIASELQPTELRDVADRSISLLLIDASEGETPIPWSALEKKLVAHPLVVALAPFFSGLAAHAGYVVATPPYLESIHELPAPFDAAKPRLAISAPLVEPRAKRHDPIELLSALSGESSTTEQLLRARVASIHAAGTGTVAKAADASTRPVSGLASADELWEALVAGEQWIGETSSLPSTTAWTLLGPARDELLDLPVETDSIVEPHLPLVLLARGTRDVTASAVVSPAMTKIYQESGLRRAPSCAVVNPQTALDLGLDAGSSVKLETRGGALLATLALDHDVMPGVVLATVGPSSTALGDGRNDGGPSLLDILPSRETWRATAASVVRA